MTRIRCRDRQCMFNKNGICTSDEIEYEPDMGCLTMEPREEAEEDEKEKDWEEEEWEDEDEDSEDDWEDDEEDDEDDDWEDEEDNQDPRPRGKRK